MNKTVRESLFLVEDDSILIYVAGHNIIMYKLDDREQYFMQGSHDTEAITHVAISKNHKYLSVCERCPAGQKGKFSIYEIMNQKRRKTLPEAIQDTNAYDSQEFICSAFSSKEERQIVTLTGEPDWQVFLWNWEREKIFAKISIGCQGPITV